MLNFYQNKHQPLLNKSYLIVNGINKSTICSFLMIDVDLIIECRTKALDQFNIRRLTVHYKLLRI